MSASATLETKAHLAWEIKEEVRKRNMALSRILHHTALTLDQWCDLRSMRLAGFDEHQLEVILARLDQLP